MLLKFDNFNIPEEKQIFDNYSLEYLTEVGRFKIRSNSSEPLYHFINRCYPNFNIFELCVYIDNELRDKTNRPIQKEIIFDSQTEELTIQYGTGKDDLWFERIFYKNEQGRIEVYHAYFQLPEAFQGQRIAKRIFQRSFRQYINMEASYIRVYAGLSGGGYVWAKHGFVAVNKEEVTNILEEAKKTLELDTFEDVLFVYDDYYSSDPDGKEFPMVLWARLTGMKTVLMGSEWEGVIDFSNSYQINNFVNYVYG